MFWIAVDNRHSVVIKVVFISSSILVGNFV